MRRSAAPGPATHPDSGPAVRTPSPPAPPSVRIAIPNEVHADDESGRFFLGHGGKLNLVRLNGRPVLATEELHANDRIRIGETVLQFVAFCTEAFSWSTRDAGTSAGRDSTVG